MRKLLKFACVLLFALFAAAQFVRPARVNPPTDDSRSLAAHARMNERVASILNRSCMDCHSNRTTWPWYSQIAPASWFVADHVKHGRQHLNLSEWSGYDRDEAAHLLSDICRTAKAGTMPLGSYTLLHRSARLSPQDVAALCEWSQTERERLAAARSETGRAKLDTGESARR
ncbi:MAG TPA: heme-binding domain-containing protein [Pyrinomonadaceae bacterium]|nr:heme-binding domain-containing protein [Pyrinomonadaceae bacterium]